MRVKFLQLKWKQYTEIETSSTNSTFKIIKIRVVYGNNGRGIILMLISIKINYFLINYFFVLIALLTN